MPISVQEFRHLAPDAPVAYKPVWCATHHFDSEPCSCEPGPAIYALNSTATELLYGGAAGGMKSNTLAAWMIKGNPPEVRERRGHQVPADAAYVNHPDYRGLVIREARTDLANFVDESMKIYRQFGAKWIGGSSTEDPHFRFTKGAKIYYGYATSEEQVKSKYPGGAYHRIGWEEAQNCPTPAVFSWIKSRNRSQYPDTLIPQMFLTANPGGVGHAFLVDRFRIPGNRPEAPYAPFTVDIEGFRETRQYIPARVTDNPYYMRDSSYIANLMGLPTQMRRMLLDGDWSVPYGAFFPELRTERLHGEPENAVHVIDPPKLKPWWHRWIAMDWGYSEDHPCAVQWFCSTGDGHVILYRERQASGLSGAEWGVIIARESLQDFAGMEDRPWMKLYMSPEAVEGSREGDPSIGHLVKQGIARVLGPEAAFLMDFTEDERHMDVDAAWQSLRNRHNNLTSRYGISIAPARNDRVSGWMRIREMLRWQPLVDLSSRSVDNEVLESIAKRHGIHASSAYQDLANNVQEETLPVLQFSRDCPAVVKSLQLLTYKEGTNDCNKVIGDDGADCCRYGAMAWDRRRQEVIPKSEYVHRQVEAARNGGADLTAMAHEAKRAELEYQKRHSPIVTFDIPRLGRRPNALRDDMADITRRSKW